MQCHFFEEGKEVTYMHTYIHRVEIMNNAFLISFNKGIYPEELQRAPAEILQPYPFGSPFKLHIID
jgi:hypothetical protein